MDELGARALDEEPDPRAIVSSIEIAMTADDVWIKLRRTPDDVPTWGKYPPEQSPLVRSMFQMLIGSVE